MEGSSSRFASAHGRARGGYTPPGVRAAGTVARRALVALLASAFLLTGLGSSALAGSPTGVAPASAAVGQTITRPADTTSGGGGCALPFGVSTTPAKALWQQSAAPKVKAPTATPAALPVQHVRRSASTSHVVPAPGRGTPVTGFAPRITAPSVVVGGSISGTVTGPGGTPLADIQVIAYSESAYAMGATAADGTYSMSAQPDSYLVYFYDLNGAQPAGYYSSSGYTADQHAATAVVVTSGDVSGISVQLPSPIWIKGKVTGPGGVALADITVGAYSEAFNNGNNTVTAADGTYAVALTPGSYVVGFDDYAGSYSSGYYSTGGFTASSASATPVVVTSSDVTGINVQLPLAIHIAGVVTGPGGVPVEGVWVDVESQTFGNAAITDASGHYSVVVVPGTYQVSYFDPAGVYPFGYYSASGFTADPGHASNVVVSSASVNNISVRLPTPIYIRGKVTGPGAVALEGISVGASSDTYFGSTTTANDGTYAISVVAGYYNVSFRDPSDTYASGYYGSAGYTSDPDAAAVVHVTTANVSNISVQLPPALHITGTVTGPGDVPLSGIEVSALSNAFSNGTTTGDDGTYSVVVPQGSYHVEFDDPTGTYVSGYYAEAGFTADALGASPVTVTTADVSGIDVQLPAPIYIRGTVTGPGGDPLGDIAVIATSSIYSGSSSTAADGTYAVSVVAGSYRMTFCDYSGVYAAGYYSATGLTIDANAATPVAVASTDVTGIDVELPLAIHISGTVTGAGGVPLAGIDVWASGDAYGADVMTRADGTYSIVVLPGSYYVGFSDWSRAYQDGYYSTSGFTTDDTAATPVVVGAADVTGIDVQMLPTVLPKAAITSLPIWAATTSISLHWRATAGTYPVAGYDVRVRRAAWNGTFGAYTTWKSGTTSTSATYSGAAGSTYCFSVQAADLYGLTSDWTAETCTAVPLDDRSLSRSSGWTAGTSSSFYKSTYLRTTRYAAKLTRTGVVARRIAIVATSCSGCGTIRVYWGSTLLKTISLNASKTTNKKLFTVVVWSAARSGTLTIKVASSGRKVLIDGVAIRRN